MKAIVYTRYGPPDVLQLKEVEKPTPKDNEVLIKVHAASVNDWDWGLLRGKPFMNRMVFGLLKPRTKILGGDIAGRIEAVGRNVKQFQPGDEVFGDLSGCGFGAFAEYVCARENALVLKPASMTFEEAAAVPQAAVLALQGFRDKRQIQKGQKVLINGAGGGAGTFAVQIARSFGADVTGVDSTSKLDMMRSIGADHVIDYTQEDFTKNGQCYDLILDFAAHHSIFDYKRALSPKGIYVLVGGSSARMFQIMFMGPLISMTGSKKIRVLMHKPNKDLVFMKELFEAGKVNPVIDRRYMLSEVPEALRYFGEGRAKGKVVITLEHNKKT
jgi:NADPH:quinone reductase-like Zn-dependent oxidoreductase